MVPFSQWPNGTIKTCNADDNYMKGWSGIHVSACVPEPYALLVGKINVTFSGNSYNMNCLQYNLTNCISSLAARTQVAVVHQPSFVMIPVNISRTWYSDKGLQVWKEIEGDLTRPKRFIGLVIAGITALVTLIASATAATVALTQTIQTAHFVNDLSKNVSKALGTQENIGRKFEKKLNALFNMVQYLRNKIQGLKLKTRLECHADYSWICVTSSRYNQSLHTWKAVQKHLREIWHSANESLDLMALHRKIQRLREAEPLRFDAAKTASDFLNQFLKAVPSIGDIKHLVLSLAVLGTGVLLLICIFPIIIRREIADILALQSDIHELKLRALP